MDKELLYNQSGIKDITAYKAITNIHKGGTGSRDIQRIVRKYVS